MFKKLSHMDSSLDFHANQRMIGYQWFTQITDWLIGIDCHSEGVAEMKNAFWQLTAAFISWKFAFGPVQKRMWLTDQKTFGALINRILYSFLETHELLTYSMASGTLVPLETFIFVWHFTSIGVGTYWQVCRCHINQIICMTNNVSCHTNVFNPCDI